MPCHQIESRAAVIARLMDRPRFTALPTYNLRRSKWFIVRPNIFTLRHEENELGTEVGLTRFIVSYVRQRHRERFESELLSLLSGADQFVDFLADHSGRDVFLALEPDETLKLARLMDSVRFVGKYLGMDWKIKTFHELCIEDMEQWKEPAEVHEATVMKYTHELAEALAEVIERVERHVLDTHREYWRCTQPVLYRVFQLYNYKYVVDGLKRI